MTKSELEQLLDLRKEIQELDAKVEKMQGQRVGKVMDRVHASMPDFPYVYTTKTITGVDNKGSRKHRRELTESELLLLKRRQQAVDTEYKISQYIKSINDSRIRRIISLRYEEGLSWDKVAAAMNCDRTYPEKLLTKYLKEHPEKKKKKKMKLSHNSHFK